MSTNSKSDNGEWIYNKINTLIKEIAKAPTAYGEGCKE